MTTHLGAYSIGLLPVSKPALWLAPTAQGKGDGSTPGDARAFGSAALAALMTTAAAIGKDVCLRSDLGVYNLTSVVSIARGGCTIRGANANGQDAFAEFVGTRAYPWTSGAANGQEAFRLNAGANNLTMRFMRFRNIGPGCIRMREALSNVEITDIELYNVQRGVVNYGNSGVNASVTGAIVKRVKAFGFSKHAISFRHNSTNILVEDCELDSQDQDKDFIAVGFSVYDNASNGIVRRVKVNNILNTGPDASYYNGDGFSGERGNYNWRLEDCEANNISDGGVDWKGDAFVLENFKASGCKRSVRLWGDALVINLQSRYPQNRGDTASTCHVFAMQNGKSRVRIQGGTFIQSSNRPIFRVDDNALLVWDAAAAAGVTASSGYQMCASEADDKTDSLFGVWNHNDATAPTITSSVALNLDENKPGKFRFAISEIANLQIQGLDATQFSIVGRDVNIKAQDYEKPGGVSQDGSNVLKCQIRVIDPNDNVSPWYNLTVTINDVADDPITPAQAIAASGATAGFWFDVSQPGCLWADTARTVPAQVGDLIKAISDLSGFGNHLVFDDGREPTFAIDNGYNAVVFDGVAVGKLGPKNGMRFAKFTTVASIKRDRDFSTGSYYLFQTGRRSLANGTSDNSAYRFGFLATATASYKINPQGSTNVSTTDAVAPLGVPLVVSLRSEDGIFRSGYNSLGMVQRADSSDLATASYPVANEQPLIGAGITPAGNYYNIWAGNFYGMAHFNVTLDDNTRFRIERQLGRAGGVPI